METQKVLSKSKLRRLTRNQNIIADYKKQIGDKTTIVELLAEKYEVSEPLIWTIIRKVK